MELATEIQRQAETKRDFVAPTQDLAVEFNEPADGDDHVALHMTVGALGRFRVTDVAQQQMADRLQIPRTFYNRIYADHPGLLTHTVNHLFREAPKTQMLRTLDGRVRAYLSDRYRPLDNDVVAETVLPIMAGNSAWDIASCEITDTRLYIKALYPKVAGEVRVGDVVQGGVVISNSEVGFGAVKVEPLVFRLACRNGMIMADQGVRRMHLGAGTGGDGGAREFWHDDTKRASDQATLMQIRDTVAAVTQQGAFDKMLETFRAAAGRAIPAGSDIPALVEVTSRRLDLQEGERKGVLDHLVRGGDLTQWGLANAVTRFSQDVDSYDRATELERLGSTVVNWSGGDWALAVGAN